jgi:outer membrane protein assembly factor BamB
MIAATRIVCGALLFLVSSGLTAAETKAHWPSFRGPGATGIGSGPATPLQWDGESGRNILWKTAIPGLGHSSPVIWGDRIFVTTAVSANDDPELKVGLYGDIEPVDEEIDHEWRLYAIDRKSGNILWMKAARKGVPQIPRHPKSSHANSTPATDGRRVVAFYGSEGLYTYDMDGALLWKKDLGVLKSGFFSAPDALWGFGSSPIIHDGRVIVQCDVLEGSFIAAFDLKDGKELWRTARDEVPSWSTPAIDAGRGPARVVANGFRHIGGYDFETGKEVWWLRGGGDVPIPTPQIVGDLIYITNAHGGVSPIYAVRRDATGDIGAAEDGTPSKHIAWSRERDGAYMPTPLVLDGALYVLRDNGTLMSYDAVTGAQRYKTRLGRGGSGYTASAVAGGGKLYLTSEMCDTYVVEPGPEFTLLETNSLDAICMATPAIADGHLYFRTDGHLIAIADQEGAGSAATRSDPDSGS